ncbi:CYTH domain-containing protein (plasmid) [Rhizobium sullae]|uniref:CYTH domain-containing protein n=1 Tax=Rhizobium sullae TaxID=50338 RepID=A0A2N0DGS1_RHISU|nr:CYTH domain-containing protein [Rhizobium sullae]PKA45314.1 CYTH domain-containing protein [Rhizobium sullae]UWU17676.1 CYTH domain-containing protein [Rhizobium sullae]
MKTIEIERKFLVRNNTWRADAIASHAFQQAYLSHGSKNTVRVRIIDGLSARLAVKFGRRGLKREEYEYEIPVAEAQELLRHANGRVLEKRRYDVSHKGRIWEVDVFGGAYQGLTIAEIEMSTEDDKPVLPRWLGREVTGDKRFSNRTMATHSFVSPALTHAATGIGTNHARSSSWSRD